MEIHLIHLGFGEHVSRREAAYLIHDRSIGLCLFHAIGRKPPLDWDRRRSAEKPVLDPSCLHYCCHCQDVIAVPAKDVVAATI